MPTVQLDWDYVQGTDPATKFRMERRVGTTGAWAMLGEIPYGAPTYDDATAAEGQSYGYRVMAVNAAGAASTPSNIASISVPGVLNAPTNLRATL